MGACGDGVAQDVDFVREIRPILSQRCFACHGPDEAALQAGLSLVTFEAATTPLRSGRQAIVPGDPDASELWRRVTDPDDPMPPADQHAALTDVERERLRRWIEQGASYAPHWAYVPPAKSEVPEVSDETWPLDEIDNYILARLDDERLSPAGDADRATLLRRLSYDLTGLPPTPGEIDAFIADRTTGALEDVVDRLLASHHFGERMAMYWLDLVRYADTVGYHGDQPHRIWPYRDYVIQSFNENRPFDHFTIEQLAGDLLPDPTQSQLIATGYNRLLQTSHEGGVQLKEYRAIYQADRIRNVSSVWMGATLGCAQCHDHKYDPFTTRDFYAMGAFFADIDDEHHLENQYAGLNTLPTTRLPEMPVMTDDERRQRRILTEHIAAARESLDVARTELPTRQPAWEAALRAEIAAGEVREQVWVDDLLDTGGRTQGDWTFVRDGPVAPHRGEAYRVQTSGGLIQHYSVETTDKTIEVGAGDTFFAWVHLDEASPPRAVMLQFNVDGNWEHRAVWGSDDIPYGHRAADWAGYRRRGELPPSGRWIELTIDAEAVGLKPGDTVSGIAFTQWGGTVYWDDNGVRTTQIAPADVAEALGVAPAARTEAQAKAVAAHHAATSPTLRNHRASLERRTADRDAFDAALPRTMYTQALDTPREVRVFPRGDWLDESGDVVGPAIPAFMGDLGLTTRASRLDLARWLVTPRDRGGVGEETARVFVNRVWSLLFGQGLCPSTEDFGGQGRPPTHPELLDRLAIDFVESGWDVKQLVRRIVLTRTYRQASIAASETLAVDPDNLLFARQGRHRLSAEMVRDTILAVSGMLVDEIGGPSVKPPQPKGHYRHLNFPPRTYDSDMGSQQWRRGVYVHWQRQFLHPMFAAFDAPTREECTTQRNISNTPVAALTLLNDPVFVEASRGFARSLLSAGPDDPDELIAEAMRRATGRRPTPAEISVLSSLLTDSLQHYAAHPDEAAAVNNRAGVTSDEGIDGVTLAAWAQVTRAILNLHETITRE